MTDPAPMTRSVVRTVWTGVVQLLNGLLQTLHGLFNHGTVRQHLLRRVASLQLLAQQLLPDHRRRQRIGDGITPLGTLPAQIPVVRHHAPPPLLTDAAAGSPAGASASAITASS